MLELFYQCVMASTLYFTAVYWRTSIGADNTSRLNELIKKDSSITGCKPDSFEGVDRRTLK